MKSECTVLISSAGRRVELIRCFRDGAARIGIDLRVIAVDVDPAMSAACQMADLTIRVPRCERAEFIEDLLAICARPGVDLVVPTIDPELEPLSAYAARFREMGVDLAVAAPELIRLARDKLRTACFLVSRGVPAPRSGSPDEVMAEPDAWLWPLMIKPRAGSSSAGIRVLSAPEQLAELGASPDCLVQKLLRGEEYTVNMFFGSRGAPALRDPSPAPRDARGRGVQGHHPPPLGARRRCLGARPSPPRRPRRALLQAIVDQAGKAVVFELNARFGGGYPLAPSCGGPLCAVAARGTIGRPSSAHNDWQNGVLMLRYDHAVFCAAPGAR